MDYPPLQSHAPSWSLALAKPAGHALSSINIFQTWPSTLIHIRSSTVSEWRDALVPPPPPPTDSYQIFHCVWMKGCSSAIPPLYTDSYQIFHCVWMKGCSSAIPPLYTDSYQIFHCVWMKDALVPSPPLYTDSYQIFHCVWMKGCSSAIPPPSTLIHIRSSTVSEWRML